MDFKILLSRGGALKIRGGEQCGKFVTRNRDMGRAILMLSIYLLLNFQNLGCTISKLSSQAGGGHEQVKPTKFFGIN
jgi:hypothetical protein